MKRLVFLCFALLMLVLAGCAQVTSEIEVKSDFSGEWKATIQSQRTRTGRCLST